MTAGLGYWLGVLVVGALLVVMLLVVWWRREEDLMERQREIEGQMPLWVEDALDQMPFDDKEDDGAL